jgi:hypothetical protein
MKIKHITIGLLVALAAGCDTMEQDVDGSTLKVNNETAYFLPGSDGYIDLGSRVVAPGKVTVEITGSTQKGVLKDLGRGLLQYSPNKGSSHDFFRFRVLSSNNQVIAEDTIGISIPSDTTKLPCKWVYTRNDSVKNVSGPVTVNVVNNDYACSGSLLISIDVAPDHGMATVIGNQIHYIPNSTFAGSDQLLYKALSTDPSLVAGYAMVRFLGADSIPSDTTGVTPPDTTKLCISRPQNDLFFKPLNDSSLMFLNVLANDSICSDSTITITQFPHHGNAFVNNGIRKIGYRNSISSNVDDTLLYQLGGTSGVARVIIKRQ